MKSSKPDEQQASSTPEQDRLLINFLEAKAQNGGIHEASDKPSPQEERSEAEYWQAEKKLNNSGLSENVIRTVSKDEANEQYPK